MGLLCRWGTFRIGGGYITFNVDSPGPTPDQKRAFDYLVKQGPSSNDVVFNFYAQMLLHEKTGMESDQWHRIMAQSRRVTGQTRR